MIWVIVALIGVFFSCLIIVNAISYDKMGWLVIGLLLLLWNGTNVFINANNMNEANQETSISQEQ